MAVRFHHLPQKKRSKYLTASFCLKYVNNSYILTMRNKKVCTCLAKDERFINDWVKHNVNIGFDLVVLGDNGLTEEQLKSIDVSSGRVIIEKYNHESDNIQSDWYNYVLETYCTDEDWLAVIDADEFITLNDVNISIGEYIDTFPDDCGAIMLWWMYYDSLLPYNSSLKQCSPLLYSSDRLKGKEIVRKKGLQHGIRGPHRQRLLPNYYVYNNSHDIIFEANRASSFNDFLPHANYNEAWIRHYRFSSYFDCYIKYQRGYPHKFKGNGEPRTPSVKYQSYKFFTESFELENLCRLSDRMKTLRQSPITQELMISPKKDLYLINDENDFICFLYTLFGVNDNFNVIVCLNAHAIILRVLGEKYGKHISIKLNGNT